LIHTYHFGNYPHLPLHYLLLEGIYSRVADKLIAVGVNQRRQIAATYRLKLQHIETVHNGIIAQPVTEEKLIMRTQVTKGIVVIGSICTFIYQKGLDYLLSVAKIMMQEESNVIFWVVGDGPLREEIEKKKEAMGLGDIVKLHGWIPNAAQNILPQFDIFLQTSRWEAMSMVILEAMVAGKPIVATDVGENRQIVLSAGAGYIVQPGEIRSTVHHLKLLAAQPDLRKTMGERGIAAVKSNYGVATMTRQYETIYAKVLKLSE
jgi:glycosyltransferase involved in cell wall biosynthesis